jgi:uncharacterized protein
MDFRPVASRRHTLIIMLVLVGLAAASRFHLMRIIAGWFGTDLSTAHPATRWVVASLLLGAISEWGIVGLISRGVRETGFRLGDLIQGRWTRWTDGWRDIAIGIGFVFPLLIASGTLSFLLTRGLGWQQPKLPAVYYPQNLSELAAMLMLCVTAGICEELIFRGYFQRQLLAFTQSSRRAFVGQAVLFGLAHAYQGPVGIVLATFLGLSFAWLAKERQSLRPGMVTHAVWDIGGAVLHYLH